LFEIRKHSIATKSTFAFIKKGWEHKIIKYKKVKVKDTALDFTVPTGGADLKKKKKKKINIYICQKRTGTQNHKIYISSIIFSGL